MAVQLIDLSYCAGSETWLHSLDLSLAPGEINVLLGATQAGKTTLMRVIAGLERPTTGRVIAAGRDVTGLSVRQRNLAMVYQQFINYPSFTVYENIASPLRLARQSASEIERRVQSVAESLRLTPYLDRYPSQLSGGQQQRTALARALAKDAELVLLDEPLVNLDYKLREELREELAHVFSRRGTTVVYATTDPQEALQLGGHTAILAEGRLIQYGPTLESFRQPRTLAAARAFSDPPLNEIHAIFDAASKSAIVRDDLRLPLPEHGLAQLAGADRIVLGIRPYRFSLTPTGRDMCAITGRVDLAEISGSDTYLHLSRHGLALIAQIPGVHDVELGGLCTLHVDSAALYCFDGDGSLLFAPNDGNG